MTTMLEPDTAGVELLPFYCPEAPAIHPEAEAIEQHCIDWVDRFHLYASDTQRARLLGSKAAEVYARALPEAPAERVADVAKWLYWGFATDDAFYDNGPTSVRAADFLAVAAQLVRLAEEPRASFPNEIPYTDALRDLVQAICRHATPAQTIDWVQTARAWFFGMAWDVGNAERGTMPALNDYLMMRMHTGGLASWITTLNIANGIELSAEETRRPAVIALTEAWSTFALLINDLSSYAKEVRNEDNSSNILRVVAQERSLPPRNVVVEAYALCDRIANLFVHLCAQVQADGSDALRRYIQGLNHTWRGILDWGFTAPRYNRPDDPSEPPFQVFPGWATEPTDTSLAPLPYPSIAWWWDHLEAR